MNQPAYTANAGITALIRKQQARGVQEHELASAIFSDLYHCWEDVGRQVPAKAEGEARFIFDLAQAVFEGRTADFNHAENPAQLQEAYWHLQKLYLQYNLSTDQAGRASVVGGIRHGILLKPREGMTRDRAGFYVPVQLSGPFKATMFPYRDVELEVRFPQVHPRAHLGMAEVSMPGAAEPFMSVPVPEITKCKAASVPIDQLATFHRFGRLGEGMALYGDWVSPDGTGRELTAAIVAGFAVRTGTAPNGMGGTSPTYALTRAGLAHVLANLDAQRVFGHYNRIEEQTAYLEGPGGRVAFDTDSGAVLGLYGHSVDDAPACVLVHESQWPIEAGKTYPIGGLRCLTIEQYILLRAKPEDDLRDVPYDYRMNVRPDDAGAELEDASRPAP